jgi:hypothetical protein
MPYLTLINNKLRIDWAASTLILSESEEEPCCCCPAPPENLCVSISAQNYNLFIEGKLHVLFKGTPQTILQIPGDLPPTTRYEDGFPECIAKKYKVTGIVKAGGYFDDFGAIESTKFDNHIPCNNGTFGSKITNVTADSAPIEFQFKEFQSNPEYFYIPISFQATSSNCGPPTSANVTICLTFEKKDSGGGSGSGSGSGGSGSGY